MSRIFRIIAIFLIAGVGALASFAVFSGIRNIVLYGRYSDLDPAGSTFLSISILFAICAALGIFFQAQILNFIKIQRQLTPDIVDEINESESSSLKNGFPKPIHWIFWTGNFAFAFGLIRLGVFLFDELIDRLPYSNFPNGLERYLLVSGIIMLGILLIYDEIVLLRNYIRKPIAK